MSIVEDALSAARERLDEAKHTGRGVDAALSDLAQLEAAAEVLTPPIEEVSLFPHRHAKLPDLPPAHLSLLTSSQRAELRARRQ